MTLDELVGRLEGVRRNGSGYKARCPAHEDAHASLSVGSAEGKILLRCFAGCDAGSICKALSIELADLFAEKQRPQRCTLSTLATAKKLPQDFLAALGLRDMADGGVGIPYRDENGATAALKRRTAIAAKEGSLWPSGKPLMPYGLDRLADAREMDHLVVVEGESDCWTLWFHGIPALGIPGANASGSLQSAHVAAIKRITAIREPDRGGDVFSAALPKRLEAIGWNGELRIVTLDGAKDPSDLHQRDPTAFKAAFERAISGADKQDGFLSAAERLEGERAERLERGKLVLPFGVRFLDELLGGIFPHDLVLVGAAPGEGKTALCTAIAHFNVRARRRVHYFALEAEEREIERRIKYREISERVYADDALTEIRSSLNYIDWYSGRLDATLGEALDAEVERVISERFASLHTFYKRGTFDVEQLARMLVQVQRSTEMAVVDHLHYVDTEDEDSNRGVKVIVMRLRDLALVFGRPILLVAHLRKRDRSTRALVPNLDDFHGTSETAKVATKGILIARARDQTAPKPHLWPTYIYAPKCRMDGARSRYCALVNFNIRTQSYEEGYVLGQLSFGLDRFEPVPTAELPPWAASAIR